MAVGAANAHLWRLEGVIRTDGVDVNCYLSQGVRAVHRDLGDAAAPTERHHLGDGADDRGLR